MRKHVLSLVLAAALCAGLLAAPAGAAGVSVTEVVPCKYDSVSNFSGGFAVVELDGKWGFVDQTGREVVPCKYDWAVDFSEGLARVKLDGKWGFIDTTGREVVPCKYDYAWDFTEGLAAVEMNDKQGFVDTTGREVVPCNKYDGAWSFSEGMARVSKDGKYGFVDQTGALVIPIEYSATDEMFSNGMVRVQKEAGGRVFAIDKSGNKAERWIEPKRVTEGLSSVEKDGKYGFADNQTGKVVIPLEYDHVSAFYKGAAWGVKNGKAFYFDKSGQVSAMPWAEDCSYPLGGRFSCGLLQVYGNDRKIGYVDKNGKVVVPAKYDEGEDFVGGFAWVKQDGKWGAVNTEGKEVVALEWDAHSPFVCGMAWVEKDGKRGVVDTTGKLVVPVGYDGFDLRTIPSGVIMVVKDRRYGLLDLEGREVLPIEYTYISAPYHGVFVLSKGENYGAVDADGNEVLPMEYRFEGMAERLIATYKNGKGGYINEKGCVVVPFEYDTVGKFSGGLAKVKKDGKWGVIKNPLETQIAQPSTQTVTVDGKKVEFAMYALNNGSVNYIRVRDLAALLNGTAAQFDVGWDDVVTLDGKTPYSGDSSKAPFSSPMPCKDYETFTLVNGEKLSLDAIQIAYNGGGYTYYKLRDLAQALGFNVGWSADKGAYVETDKPYDPNN